MGKRASDGKDAKLTAVIRFVVRLQVSDSATMTQRPARKTAGTTGKLTVRSSVTRRNGTLTQFYFRYYTKLPNSLPHEMPLLHISNKILHRHALSLARPSSASERCLSTYRKLRLFFLLRSARQHSTPVAGDSCLPVSLYPSMSVFICTLWISAE